MKQMLVLGGILSALATNGFAQSRVQMYGVLDDGVTFVNNKGGASSVALADGIARSDRWGFIGQEDLGHGRQAIFKLEGSFSLNNGTLGNGLLFSHEAYVGLKDAEWGQVTLGRQYDFTDFQQRFLPCLYCGVYITGNADLDRVAGEAFNNAVRFISRDYRGLKVGAMYSFASGASGTTNYGRAYSLSAEYTNGPFSAMAVTTNVNDAITHVGSLGTRTVLGVNNTSPNLVVDNQRILNLATSWKFTRFQADLLYTNTRLTLGGRSSTDQTLRVGGDYTAAPNLIIAGGTMVERFENSRWYNFDAGIKYLLSKRTSVYIAGLFQRASGPGTVASISTVGVSSNRSQLVERIGMTHAF